MEDIVGKKILIHGYKHNGKIHRCWSKGLVLQETDDHYIVINNRTLVTESDGRMWHTREPAIWYMPKHKWYNVICMIRKTGVYYYSNIASPTLYDGEALKYIDYDLDLKGGCAFMLGNEARGLSDKAAKMCDRLVKIPMPGGAESLNASVAAAVLIYEAVRQRHEF